MKMMKAMNTMVTDDGDGDNRGDDNLNAKI